MNELKNWLEQYGSVTILVKIKSYIVTALLLLVAFSFSMQLNAENKLPVSSESNNVNPVIEIQVPAGKLRIELYQQHAPVTVAKLIELVKAGYYNQSTVYDSRQNLGFVIAKTGESAESFDFKDETNTLSSQRGSFAISKSTVSKAYLNNLFVGFNKQPDLEKHYFIIGQVLEGLELVEKNPSGEIRPISSFSMVEDSQVSSSLKKSSI